MRLAEQQHPSPPAPATGISVALIHLGLGDVVLSYPVLDLQRPERCALPAPLREPPIGKRPVTVPQVAVEQVWDIHRQKVP